jgi:hypothetical protein
MSWSSRFDDPIVLPNGQKLETLRDATSEVFQTPSMTRRNGKPRWKR